jgi:hypothetical protein
MISRQQNYIEMNDVIKRISACVDAAPDHMRILDWLFGDQKSAVLTGKPVVLFGTGSLGKELMESLNFYGVYPVCFCNSITPRTGRMYCELPVLSVEELKDQHSDSVILIATQTYAASVKKLLLDNGFDNRLVIWPKDFDMATGLYFSHANQITLTGTSKTRNSRRMLFNELMKNEHKLKTVFNVLADNKSKELFVKKLALAICHDNIGFFSEFILSLSEPIAMFGLIPFPESAPENFFLL